MKLRKITYSIRRRNEKKITKKGIKGNERNRSRKKRIGRYRIVCRSVFKKRKNIYTIYVYMGDRKRNENDFGV